SSVTGVNSRFGHYGNGQSTLARRVGFASQISPSSGRLVLSGGYGTYYSRPPAQASYQHVFGAPFCDFRLIAGAANADATFQVPFQQPFPTPESFPSFPSYSPTTSTMVYSVAPGFRPSMIQ